VKLAQRLRKLREVKHLSQEQVAAACKVFVSTVFRWEEGTTEPRRKAFRLLAQILEVSSSYLNGEVQELENLSIAEVACRESFRIFAERAPLSQLHREPLERVRASGIGPVTVAEWASFSQRLAIATQLPPVNTGANEGAEIIQISPKGTQRGEK
jgi:transcriptional regulator with XRE-family HTH domain